MNQASWSCAAAVVGVVALAVACGGPQRSLNRRCAGDDECFAPQVCEPRSDSESRCTLVCSRDQECAEVLGDTCFRCFADDGRAAEDVGVEGECAASCR